MAAFAVDAKIAFGRKIAQVEDQVAVVGLERFRSLIVDDPALLLELARQLAFRLKKTSEKLGNLAFLDVTGRISRALIDLAADEEATLRTLNDYRNIMACLVDNHGGTDAGHDSNHDHDRDQRNTVILFHQLPTPEIITVNLP